MSFLWWIIIFFATGFIYVLSLFYWQKFQEWRAGRFLKRLANKIDDDEEARQSAIDASKILKESSKENFFDNN